ncbi:beta-(1 2)-xylosyltransferase [Tripterygium wilfordii]|uniref:Beta-(1 2)-xylosyltransferase n=1 Tax=Tripterygium wilfordii TaxID=458696 RepID=A0A7J7C1C8_TRIWF|nr:beta-1,2-xylosyltransferase-like [Tripterygium wilfordii]KAF5727923.1 beta-(1 2)-xylosyltransferase [Tripterygium wilfordii]
MKRTHWRLLQILLFLFALNSVSLVLYFTSHHYHNDNTSNSNSVTENSLILTENRRRQQHSLKPWPILPSYLPWSPDQKVVPRSCEAYFGNGFTRRVDLLPSSSIRGAGSSGGGGWFRCFYSETLRSSICEGGKVRMVPERIKMTRGGESLEEVVGRGEEEELPEFEDGAFEVLGVGGQREKRRRLANQEFLDQYIREGQIMRHTMRELLKSARVVEDNEFQCDEWIEEPTLFVTRFEYANLFHTVTDWYSAYVSSRVTGLPNRPRLIFVDGHCKAPLEQTWKALFSGLRYAKNFSGPVCFRHAILSPLGYETALFKGLTEEINCQGASAPDLWQKPDDQKTARLSEFGEMIRAAFGFPVNRHRIEKPALGHNVLFVRREDYLAHPRHGGKVESRLSNEEEVYDSLQKWASNYSECKINLVNGLFAHMSMREQVRLIQDASVIIGAHGAGLTHIVSATPKTVVLEIISSQFRRPHFALIAQWKGLEYHAINLHGSYARPVVVIERLSKILRSLEC